MDGLKIGFIGAGNIASALIDGIITGGVFAPEEIGIFDIDTAKTSEFAARGIACAASGAELAAQSDIIVLAVKPQVIGAVLEEIGKVCGGKYLISVAAGISSDYIRSFAPGAIVLRTMPNTPMLIGRGAIAIARPEDMDETTLAKLAAIFSCCGRVEIIDQEQMNAVIAINGSSPAFFYRFVNIMADYAKSHGIDYDTAIRLSAAAMEGAAAMVLKGEKDPAQLIRDVSSPGGTTLAALAQMDENGLDDIFKKALEACNDRAEALSR